jgi:hypothetical protein
VVHIHLKQLWYVQTVEKNSLSEGQPAKNAVATKQKQLFWMTGNQNKLIQPISFVLLTPQNKKAATWII